MNPNIKNSLVLAFIPALVASLCLGCEPMSGADPSESEGADEVSGEPIGEAEGALTMSCLLGANDCGGPITETGYGNGRFVAKVNMSGGYRRMDVFAKVCNPTGWTLHVTDSPTADGYGGDGATTDHDAEGYLLNTTFQFFSSYDLGRAAPGTFAQATNAFAGPCSDVHMVAFHAAGSPTSTFSFQGSPSQTLVSSLYGMKVGYTSCPSGVSGQRSIECDWEDAALADKDLWYVGVNRVVNTYPGGREGTGVQKACIVLNSNVNTVPLSCL